ncbi:MAG TPA: ABC transporter ATP-binding protein [Longimicrobiales bacterium]
MIRYERFTKRYGAIEAVSGLDLEVREGETLALIGPNGSGKTTTLKAAVGLVRPTAGRVTIAGRDARCADARARETIGYLPQRLSFPPRSTGREVLAFFARLRDAAPGEIERRIEQVGLGSAADRPVEGYSGGMRQRLGVAAALLGRPRALILDEPTAALDPTAALALRDLIRDVRAEGTTVLLSSHDLAEVAALADRIAIFVRGHLAALGTAGHLAALLGLHDGRAGIESIYRIVTEDRHAFAP